MLARSTQLSTRAFTRSFHASKVARGAHAHSPVPFSHKNKVAFAAKVIVFFAIPFSIPFGASAWQIYKSAGGDA
ncbi:hypothetical protein BDV98DRAFT_601029 [Pterulicium gracile]|uniref:Cytochrome c oxidase subunit 8, mitochondrial n=1 Tax=Pterulicium gracile TaxID=1884261 RepID=A0A5C3QWD3_9AGAR|nr:hypothetical protein BDV98DRAFT_601029 [Pterula gracilis]